MALLTANAGTATIKEAGADNFKVYDVGADVHIWHNGFVGLDPAGNAKSFEAGDRLAGIAYQEADNTAVGNAVGDKTVIVHTHADFVMPISGAAKTDVGRSVFATTDNQTDASFIGHPDAYIGQMMQLTGTNAVVRIANPGKMPADGDNHRAQVAILSGHEAVDSGAVTATTQIQNVEVDQVLGLGFHTPVVDIGGGAVLELDATSEVSRVNVRNTGAFAGDLGMTLECDINAETWAGSACDLNIGFTDEYSNTELVNLDLANSSAFFHLDGASANILAESDDNTVEVAATDTTIDNVTTSGAWKRLKVIVRVDGTVEFWIDNARVLAASVFGIDETVDTYKGGVFLEKTTGTNAAVVMLRRLRIAGVSAL